jgi:transcriptional regulator with XRE-family HTH domain
MDNSREIGRRLVAAFENCGITSKKAISEALGFKSENAVYKVISGERELNFDALIRFAQRTGRSIDWLLKGDLQETGNSSEENDAAKLLQANEAQPETADENPQEFRDLLVRYFAHQELIALYDEASPRGQAKMLAIARGIAHPESIPVAHAVDSGTKERKKAS